MLNLSSIFLLIFMFSCSKSNDLDSKNSKNSNDSSLTPSSYFIQLGSTTSFAFGGNSDNFDMCFKNTVDNQGNLYCAGETRSSLGEVNGGGQDILIMKIDPQGEILWIKQIGASTQVASSEVINTSLNDECSSIAVDSDQNVYCSGSTKGSLGEASGGGSDAFVLKLNSVGEVQWITQLGADTQASSSSVHDTSATDFCNGVSVDNNGNVYASCQTYGGLAETNGGSSDIFLLKLNGSGSIQWVKQLGATTAGISSIINSTDNTDVSYAIALDSAGNIVIAGETRSSIADIPSGLSYNLFLMSFDSSGSIQWATQLGTSSESTYSEVVSTSGNTRCYSMKISQSGSIFCGGYTTANLAETSGGGNDIFVAKFSSSGSLSWISQVGATTEASSAQINSVSGSEACYGIAVDSNENVLCVGDTESQIAGSLGPWSWDPLAAKFDSSGSLVWVTQLGPSILPSTFQGGSLYGAAVDSNGSLYAAGEGYGDVNDTDVGENGDNIIVKFAQDGSIDI